MRLDLTLLELVPLIPLLPLLAALWIAIGYLFGDNRGEAGEKMTSRVALFASGFSLLLIFAIDVVSLNYGMAPGQVVLGEWLAVGDYQVNISFTLDKLGLMMTTLVALIAFLTLRFSVNYMHREAGFQRFFMVMSLFTAAMLLIVSAGNALLMFIGWELAGVSSYLLIAYVFERPTATANATRAFVTNRIGDAGFILALFLAISWFGGVEWPTLLAGSAELGSLGAALLAGAFLIAALAKSAQFPFVPWIGRALEGPTPSSAIFYGSLMVHAGVYLLIRLEPLLTQVPALAPLIIILGGLSVLYGWLGSQVQTDVKSGLMFATTAQVGLMFIEIGLGWYELASWHLMAHASWRALQFLSAPSMLMLVEEAAKPVPAWLRKRRWLYNAALQRFWLDDVSDGLLLRPTESLAREVERFDATVVNRMVGHDSSGVVSSAESKGGIGTARGLLGRGMEWLATNLEWLEENLILRGGGEGLMGLIARIGKQAQLIEKLLEQPRYLWLMIMATLVVVL
jgi:NADH:ubiquinone oxidoreductase subunit 5 (subunit L)/multisubunit Na+/H+ antiporter MnhA subunit